MRILLTGASGFLGRAFLQAATQEGHQVICLSRRPPPENSSRLEGQMELIQAALDQAPWERIRRLAPSACVHSAWITSPGVYLESEDNDSLLEVSRSFLTRATQEGVTQILGIGTCLEYGPCDGPLGEGSRTLPISRYARCKQSLSVWLEQHAKECGIRAAWARVFYPYGPHEHPRRLASSIIQSIRNGETVRLKTPASVKDYIHCRDVAQAWLRILQTQYAGPINVGTGEGTSVLALAQTIGRILGRPELVECAADPAVDSNAYMVSDPATLHTLAWQAKVPLETGLKELAEL